LGEALPAKTRMFRRRRVIVDQRRTVTSLGGAMTADREFFGCPLAADCTQHRRAQHDQRKRRMQQENRQKRQRRNRPEQRIFKRPRPDPVGREQHDRGHRGLDAVQHSGHGRHLPPGQINPAQSEQNEP